MIKEIEYFVILNNKFDSEWDNKKDLICYIEDLITEGNIDLSKLKIIKGQEIWFGCKLHFNKGD